jgi:hypothetical protein
VLHRIIFITFGGDSLLKFNGFGFPENIDELAAVVDAIGPNNHLLRWLLGIEENGSAKVLNKQFSIFFGSKIVCSTSGTPESEAKSQIQPST